MTTALARVAENMALFCCLEDVLVSRLLWRDALDSSGNQRAERLSDGCCWTSNSCLAYCACVV